jgi:choline dehydrogenase
LRSAALEEVNVVGWFYFILDRYRQELDQCLSEWHTGRDRCRCICVVGRDPPPRIHARYLSEARDLELLLEAVSISREIIRSAAFAAYRGIEVFPDERVTTPDALTEVVRCKAETIYQPVGTCRMGSDEDAVVDCELRVQGVDGLRLVDASVMPRVIGGNINAPTNMIAEKVADGILSAIAR